MIYVVLDSNILHFRYEKAKQPIYDICINEKIIRELIEIRESGLRREDIQLIIPEMVIRELIEQQVKQYLDDVEIFKDISLRLGVEMPSFLAEKELRDRLNSLIQIYLENNEIIVVPICSKNNWSKIINKAIYKVAPFEGVEKKSDKGFKDTVIFYSIIEYANDNIGLYYFVTKDGIFTGKSGDNGIISRKLKQEFFDSCNSSIKFISDIDELKRNILKSCITIDMPKIDYNTEDKLIIRESDSSKVPTTIKCTIPVFDNATPLGKAINEEICDRWNKYLGSWKMYSAEKYPDEPDMEYEGIFDVNVKYNEEYIISIYICEYMFTGGAHGITAVDAITYDCTEGKMLSLVELLKKSDNDIRNLINKCINDDVKDNLFRAYYENEYNISDVDNVVFYIMDGEVHIVFNEYEVAPYSEGIIDLILCEL